MGFKHPLHFFLSLLLVREVGNELTLLIRGRTRSVQNHMEHASQGIIFLVSHRNLLCIFDMTAIQNIFCVAVFFHRSVQNLI